MRTYRARLLTAASVTLMLASLLLSSLPAAATPSGDRLIAAAQDGLTAEVGALIANRTGANGVSPLMLAIDSNAPGMVKLLLANGANANLARENGETPLMHAVQAGSLEMVQMLQASKADVNAREKQFDQSALMWAAGHPELTTLLLAHGADFRTATKSWETSTLNYITTTSTLRATGIPR